MDLGLVEALFVACKKHSGDEEVVSAAIRCLASSADCNEVLRLVDAEGCFGAGALDVTQGFGRQVSIKWVHGGMRKCMCMRAVCCCQ